MSVFTARIGILVMVVSIRFGSRGNVFTAWGGSGDGRGDSLHFKVQS